MSDVKTPARDPSAGTTQTVPMTTRSRAPLEALRSDMERMFHRVWSGSPLTGLDWPRVGATGWASPAIEFSEAEKAYTITAELPGLDKDDVDLSLQEDMLVLSGEKRSSIDEDRENVHVSERHYGRFQRAFSLPADADPDRIEAEFKNGVLAITLPRNAGKRASKPIKVK